MPGCAAVGCSNSSVKGFIMKCFPRDQARRNEWVIKTRRPNWVPTNNSYLCEVHFAPEMWEKVRIDGKRKLKHNAIPSIFPNIQDSRKKTKEPKNCEEGVRMPDISNNRETTIVETLNENIASSYIILDINQVEVSNENTHLSSSDDEITIVKMELDLKPNISNDVETIFKRIKENISSSSSNDNITGVNMEPDSQPIVCNNSETIVQVLNENILSSSSDDEITIEKLELDMKTHDMETIVKRSQENISYSSSNDNITRVNMEPDSQSIICNNMETLVQVSNESIPLSSSDDEITIEKVELDFKPNISDVETIVLQENIPSSSSNGNITQVNIEPDSRLNISNNMETVVELSNDNIPARSSNDDITKVNMEVSKLKQKLSSYELLYIKERRRSAQFMNKLKCMRKKYAELKSKYEQDSLLRQMFTPDQIDVLMRKQRKKSAKFSHVSDSTIIRALHLKLNCGKKAYTELIRQGHPLPSIRTLQRNFN